MIRAVILDMDGVISDTLRQHALVEGRILKRFGVRLSAKEITVRYKGRRTSDMFKELLAGRHYKLNELLEEKWRGLHKLLDKRVKPVPGALKLITELHAGGFKLAVGSSSPRKSVETILRKLKLKNKFSAVVAAEDVKKGKPDPECFLLAAKRLGIRPDECVVIEDAEPGMIAAKRAGMKCIGLVDKKDSKYLADILVNGLGEVNISGLKNL